MIFASEDSLAEEARTQILPRMKTITDSVVRFTRPVSPAAVGAMSFVSQDDDEIEETEEEKVLLQLGLSNASSQAFEEFLGTLSPTNKLLAKVFYKTHTCNLDPEFSAIAAAESTNSKFQFPWAELLTPSEEHKNQKIAGVSVPLLIAACSLWSQSKHSAAAKDSGTSAIGDEDRVVTKAVQGDEEEEEDGRAKTIAQLAELLQEQMTVAALPQSLSALTLTRAVSDLENIASQAVGKTERGKVNDEKVAGKKKEEKMEGRRWSEMVGAI